MKKYVSAIIYFLNVITANIVLVLIFSNNTVNFYKTSLLASFLFFLTFMFFSKTNNLYNFSHNKTLHK